MRDICTITVSLDSDGNLQIDELPTNTVDNYETISNETDCPEQGHQGYLPGLETVSEADAASCFNLTVPELHQLYLLGGFPAPIICEDDSPRWLFGQLVLWGWSGCPPVAEWDEEATAEAYRASFRHEVRMILEKLAYSASEVIGEKS